MANSLRKVHKAAAVRVSVTTIGCCLQDNAVVTALIGLFTAFAERENSQAPSQAVDPTQLRVALGNLEGDKFRVGRASNTYGNLFVDDVVPHFEYCEGYFACWSMFTAK